MNRSVIGLDRKIALDWLDAAAARVAAGDDPSAAREYLWNLLEGTVSGHSGSSARGKTVSILSRVWIKVPSESRELRDRAAEFASRATSSDRFAVHFAMIGLAYPFFFETNDIIGRLTKLEGDFTLARLQRRLVELWGDRSTVRKASQRIVRMLVDWDVLVEEDDIGRFRRGTPQEIGVHAALILIESTLRTMGAGAVRLPVLLDHAAMFPFQHRTTAGDLRDATALDVHRDGSMSDVVEVRV